MTIMDVQVERRVISIQDERHAALPAASGAKYRTAQGHTAIRDGIKATGAAAGTRTIKPRWVQAHSPTGVRFETVATLVDRHGLATVCREAHCPNIGECWNTGTATLMLLGSVCTRACRFCSVDTGNPHGWLDPDEPAKVAETVATLALDYVVLTCVDRDDLPDGGAAHFACTVRQIRERRPGVRIEALTSDFQGHQRDIETVLDSGIDVFAQNIETVERLTGSVRDSRAGYRQTLDVLSHARRHMPAVLRKSSLMLGLGEHASEVEQTMDDLLAAGTQILTLGQYMPPTRRHFPVSRWIEPQEFEHWRQLALAKGFAACISGPLVRSSYKAHTVWADLHR